MPSRYAQHTSRKETPQTEQADSAQVKNTAGGYSFTVDCWTRLQQFLVLGAEGGTYYISEKKLTKDNVKGLDECIRQDYERTISMIVAISEEGRAPKQAPAIFSLAYLSGHDRKEVRKAALDALPRVCRTGTHLFQFLADVESFRGWGRLLREAVANWYTSKNARQLAYQVTKYQQREGESHEAALRRAHARSDDPHLREVLAYAADKLLNLDDNFNIPEDRLRLYTQVRAGQHFSNWLSDDQPHRQLLGAVEAAKRAGSENEIVKLIEDHRLVRECIPTEFLNSTKVWDALLAEMPLGAMIRNIGKMTSIGLIAPMSEAARTVQARLKDQEFVHGARIHPMSVLLALTTYQAGRGVRGKLSWSPVPQVSGALDDCFYLAFKNVEPTGKRWSIGLDCSGSMSWNINNSHLSCCMAAGAMAMVTARSEENYYLHGFADSFIDLTKTTKVTSYWGNKRGQSIPGITSKSSLDAVVEKMNSVNFGGTDCSLPMVHALEKKIPVDVFAVYTDSETWAGAIHPHQALENYRQKMGINAKLIVVGMASNGFTIAKPSDPGMLDVVGFDSTVPAVMADFVRN